MSDKPSINTDRELFREKYSDPPGDFYAPSIFVTAQSVHVMSIKEWHKRAQPAQTTAPDGVYHYEFIDGFTVRLTQEPAVKKEAKACPVCGSKYMVSRGAEPWRCDGCGEVIEQMKPYAEYKANAESLAALVQKYFHANGVEHIYDDDHAEMRRLALLLLAKPPEGGE